MERIEKYEYYITKPVFAMHEVLLKVSRAMQKEIFVAVRKEKEDTVPYIIYKSYGGYFLRSISTNSFLENLKELEILGILLIPNREISNRDIVKRWKQISKEEVDKDFIPLSKLLPDTADIVDKFYNKGHWGYLTNYENKE